MSTVFLAWDRDEGRRVALKLFHPWLVRQPGFFRRFQRESDAGRRVDNPHVVRTYAAEIQTVGGEPCAALTMEHVAGTTLRGILARDGALPEARARDLGAQVADGLAAVHAAGVLHRDVKPENVIVTEDGVAKLLDLGLARLSEECLRLTGSGAFVGTVAYAAPEQFAGEEPGPATDLHALGLLLYEMVTGDRPFPHARCPLGTAPCEGAQPPSPRAVVPTVSASYDDVVRRLLPCDPARRLASAATVRDLLSSLAG
jgi:serine/threonine-protein kinase